MAVGPFTTILEVLATAVGAGALLGGSVMGVIGLAVGWSRQELAERAISDGYLGAAVGAGLAFIDLVLS